MRAKSILLLMVALGCGMVAAVAVSKTLMERDSRTPGEASIEILVATKEFKTAAQISAEGVKLEKWPKSRVPEGAITDLSMIEGKFARQGIFTGEPILAPKLADSNSSLSTQIPAGHTLFNIPFNNNYIKAGDIVDISGVFKCFKSKKTEVMNVLREIQVFAINGINDRDYDHKGGKDTVFQLLIRQEQHQALMLASNMGKLELNLRPLGGDGSLKDSSDSGDSFLAWAREFGEESVAVDEPSSPPPANLVATQVCEPEEEAPAKSEIVIITPEGVTKYEFSGSELPRAVRPEDKLSSKNQNYPANPFGSYSGYGGYTPTYPNAPGTAPGVPPFESAPVETTPTANPPSGQAPMDGPEKESAKRRSSLVN